MQPPETGSQSNSNPYAPPQTDLTASDDGQQQLASLWQRLAAVMIDGIAMTAVLLPIIMVFFGGWTGYAERAAEGGFVMELGFTLAGMVVYLAINGVWLARYGQSVGKKVMGTKIVRTDGSQADFQRILFRRYIPYSIVAVIPYIGYLLSILNILPIFGETRRCVHDRIADTKVVIVNS